MSLLLLFEGGPTGNVRIPIYLDHTTGLLREIASPGQLSPAILPNVAVSRIVAVGHSYLAGGGASSADRQLGSIIASLTGADISNFGIGGAEVGNDDNGLQGGGWARVLQEPTLWPTNRIQAPRVPNGYVGLTLFTGNDVLQHHGDAVAGFNDGRTVHKNGMRTVISRLMTSQLYEDSDTSVAYGGGTWQAAVDYDMTQTAQLLSTPWITANKAAKWNSGYSYRPFPANSATFTITIPSDFEGGVIAVGLIAYPNSDATITWSGTCSAATGTTALAGQAYNSNVAGTGQRSSNIGLVKRFTCLSSDASTTIIGTVSGMATTTLSTPSAPGTITHGGTAGATSYTYAWVAVNVNGDTVLSTTTNTATGNATLTGTNTNIIPAPSFPSGALAMKLIRTASSGSGNGGTVGWIATITTSASVTDSGAVATAYTARTANPLVAGGSFDYWQIEATNPNQVVLIVNQPRPLPGSLPQAGGTGGYIAGGYVGGPAFGTTAITAGGGAGATTVTINYAGLTAAQQSFLIPGGIVNLTGGANPTEAFYINSINVGTGVITISTLATSQVGAVTQSGHTTVGYGYAQDADILNYNSDLQSLAAEFGSTAVYVDIDTAIHLDQKHYYFDGVHLNDRGYSIIAGTIATAYSQVLSTLQPYQQATLGRSHRRPENFVIFQRNNNSVPLAGDVILTSTTWANLADTNGVAVALNIAAKAGDWLELSLSGIAGNQAVNTFWDVATMSDATTPINYTGYGGASPPSSYDGVGAWVGISTLFNYLTGSVFYQVKPADLTTVLTVPSIVQLQVRYYNSSATTRTLLMGTYQFSFTAENRGRPSAFVGSP